MNVDRTAFAVWLIDRSGSMVGERWKILCEAVRKYQEDCKNARLVAFATEVCEVKSLAEIRSQAGCTNLHLALDYAASLMAAHVVVFTDGEPSDMEACFRAAVQIPGVVNATFCGDHDDRTAINFCEKLSRDNGGKCVSKDILRGESLICSEVRDLLGLPSPLEL